MTVLCDMLNGPCACGSWHRPGDGSFGQPGMWPNKLPNGGQSVVALIRPEPKLSFPHGHPELCHEHLGPSHLRGSPACDLANEKERSKVQIDTHRVLFKNTMSPVAIMALLSVAVFVHEELNNEGLRQCIMHGFLKGKSEEGKFLCAPAQRRYIRSSYGSQMAKKHFSDDFELTESGDAERRRLCKL